MYPVAVPLKAVPNQKIRVVLDGQNCIIHLFQRGENLFMDLSVGNIDIIKGFLCPINTHLPQYPNANFKGKLFFMDIVDDKYKPNYEGLGTDYILFYAPEAIL